MRGLRIFFPLLLLLLAACGAEATTVAPSDGVVTTSATHITVYKSPT